MNCEGKHHFRFRSWHILVSTFLLALQPLALALSMPNGCQEVAVYGMNWNIDSIKEDFKFVGIFTDCVRDVYRLYNQSDSWSLVQKVISPEVRDVVRLVRKMSSESLTFDGIQLLFVSAYFFETIELYDRAMNLEVNYKLHQIELELLRTKKIQPLADSINVEIVPLLENITSSSVPWGRWGACYALGEIKKKSTDLIDELHNIIAELRGMARVTYRDIKESSSIKTAALTSVGPLCIGLLITLCFGSRPTPGVQVSVLSSVVVAVVVGCYLHFSNDVKKILDNLDELCKEIHECRRFLQGRPPIY